MSEKTRAAYGSWPSPVDAAKVASAGSSLQALQAVGDTLFWIEGRPQEGGRNVIVTWEPGKDPRDLFGPDFNARTAVHEYGGGSYLATESAVYFSNFADQRVYVITGDAAPRPITSDGTGHRFADFCHDPQRGNLYCVCEDHSKGGEPGTTLVALDLTDNEPPRILFEGTDFVAAPRLSPDGKRLAFVTWDHPNMPWDNTALHLATLDKEGTFAALQTLDQPKPGSIVEPTWTPQGQLAFVADWSEWWNLYLWQDGTPEPLTPMEAEFCAPAWVFARQHYAFQKDGTAFVSFTRDGSWQTATLDPATGALSEHSEIWSSIDYVTSTGNGFAFLGERADAAPDIFKWEGGNLTAAGLAPKVALSKDQISIPRAVSYPSGNGETAYGFFYPPASATHEGPAEALPPLIVKVHGGPTSAATSSYSSKTQYWTSRGFAVLDLNYRGSTGFGRTYRHRLYGDWGVTDVEDALFGAQYLAERKWVDGSKLAITGGSAGGYTVLAALTFHDVFTAGASHYGISDMEALAGDTHKFESRYTDNLIGPYPEARDVYRERSPIHYTEQLKTPVILLQGLEDKVVPPDQSERIFKALKDRGIPVAYLPFAGEGHGFRRAETVVRALEAELYFYGKAFGFTPADQIAPVDIENEDKWSKT